MWRQVKELSKCSVCNTYQPKQWQEPLLYHDSPALPWSNVRVELFIFESRSYVITVDYFSNILEEDYLTSAAIKAAVKKLKEYRSVIQVCQRRCSVITLLSLFEKSSGSSEGNRTF
jgi:hypothetical protein